MRRVARKNDRGMAMVTVVGSMTILMVLVLGALAYTVHSQKFARYDQDYNAAMTAAQAGVDDYISRLNRKDTYHLTLDCSNEALKGPVTVTNSCGWNSTTAPGWLPVSPGGSATDGPAFHYAVDASKVKSQGTVVLTSTGRSRDVYRTIEVAVGKGGSTDYVYYTDFESGDPANKLFYSGTPPVACGQNGTSQARYYWESPTRSGCTEIQFAPGDVLDGRVFSNDAIMSNGATFQQGIESANPDCKTVTSSTSTWRNCLRAVSTRSATFGKQPVYANPLYLDDNSTAFVDYPGCHYYGATRVIFNANGTMTVWSKDSNFTGAVIAVPDSNGTTPSCGTGSALASTAGATVPVPSDMVIYVAAAPTSGPGAVVRRQFYAGEIGGPSGSRLPLGTYSAAHANPPASHSTSYVSDVNMASATRYKGEGNLYVQGVLKGRVTVAAAQSVIVTGDVVLAGGLNGTDMLGLVATNSVEVMHPRLVTYCSIRSSDPSNQACRTSGGSGWSYKWSGARSEGESGGTGSYGSYGTWPQRINDPTAGTRVPTNGVQIAGSIQTLLHSFLVQEYNKGPHQGELLVRGSIAQRWRGAVGQTSSGSMSGYDKNYTYDERLKYSAPPYFPNWVNAEWSLRYSGELNTPDTVKSG